MLNHNYCEIPRNLISTKENSHDCNIVSPLHFLSDSSDRHHFFPSLPATLHLCSFLGITGLAPGFFFLWEISVCLAAWMDVEIFTVNHLFVRSPSGFICSNKLRACIDTSPVEHTSVVGGLHVLVKPTQRWPLVKRERERER